MFKTWQNVCRYSWLSSWCTCKVLLKFTSFVIQLHILQPTDRNVVLCECIMLGNLTGHSWEFHMEIYESAVWSGTVMWFRVSAVISMHHHINCNDAGIWQLYEKYFIFMKISLKMTSKSVLFQFGGLSWRSLLIKPVWFKTVWAERHILPASQIHRPAIRPPTWYLDIH